MMKNINSIKSHPRLLLRPDLDLFKQQTRLSTNILSTTPSNHKNIRHSPILPQITTTHHIHRPNSSLNSNKQNQPNQLTSPTFAKNKNHIQNIQENNSNSQPLKQKNYNNYSTKRNWQLRKQQNQQRKSQFKQMKDKVKQIQQNIKRIKTNIKMQKIQSKQQNQKLPILNFITQVPPPPSQLLHCTSQTYLGTKITKSRDHKYYISTVISAFYQKNNTSFTQLCKNHLISSMQLLKLTKRIERPKLPNIRTLQNTHKKTLVFDLDQTLIHCNQNAQNPCDVVLKIIFPNADTTKVGINVRPGAFQCLKQLSELYQIIVFTASHQCYANVVIDYLDPNKNMISHRYFRDSCYRAPEGFYVKDLRVIDRSLQNMLLIDNAAYSYGFQVENGIPVIPFYDNKTDNELKHLVTYLRNLHQKQNLRKQNMNVFKMQDYGKYNEPMQLISKLYNQFIYQ